ncbi:DedA family protein [Rhodococcus sp. RS1C4]
MLFAVVNHDLPVQRPRCRDVAYYGLTCSADRATDSIGSARNVGCFVVGFRPPLPCPRLVTVVKSAIGITARLRSLPRPQLFVRNWKVGAVPNIGLVLVCLAGVCAPYLLGAASVVLLAESALLVGLVLPGTSTVLIVGSVVGLGRVDPIVAAVVMVVASSGGAQTAFLLRRRRGDAGSTPIPPKRAVPSSRVLRRAQNAFDRHATVASVASHLFGGTRTFGPRLAAASPMSFRTFALCNFTAAALWVTVLMVVGNTVGANPNVAPYLIAAGVGLMAVTYGVGFIRRRGQTRSAGPVDTRLTFDVATSP